MANPSRAPPSRARLAGSGTEVETKVNVTPPNPFKLNPKRLAAVWSSLSKGAQVKAPIVPHTAPVLFKIKTSEGSAIPVVAKNWSDVMTPPVTVKVSVTWWSQFVAVLPPARAPNPAGKDVRISELAAPVPEPFPVTNGRSNVPVRVPVTVPEVRGTVKSYMLAIAFGRQNSPTIATAVTADISATNFFI